MNSIRRWLYRPKKGDDSHLAQFFFADEELNLVAAELDSFDGRKDPERCTALVNQLRLCQDRVLTIIQKIMDDVIAHRRANRDFRVKFPDDVLQENLAGQLWFGAECLAAGSSIMNREVESASMRPLARALTKNLDSLRCILREQCLRNVMEYTERIREALIIFDKLFAEFELSYVSAMVPVKTMKEYDMLQEVTVLFSETVQRALRVSLLSQDTIDDYDPALMFTIPRLAIVCGLLIYPEGPLNPDMEPTNMSEMFRPFQTLLFKIRELLYTLSTAELNMLEKSLCSMDEPDVSTPAMAGRTAEQHLQIDQGFDEGGDTLVPLEGTGSSILVHTPNSGSPVTPVNALPDLDFHSPSTETLVDGQFPFSGAGSDCPADEDLFSGLNKSESQDSGLHSENVSTSDTVTVDVPPAVSAQRDVAGGGIPASSSGGPVQGAGDTGEEISGMGREDLCVKSCCRPETGSCVHHSCREIVEEIVAGAVALSEKEQEFRQQPMSRQFSWQYNVQFAIPRVSVGEEERESDSGSFSSDSTLSDHSQAGQAILSDLVLDTLVGAPSRLSETIAVRQVHSAGSQTYTNRTGLHSVQQLCTVCDNGTTSSDSEDVPQLHVTTNSYNRLNGGTSDELIEARVINAENRTVQQPKRLRKKERGRGTFERIHCKTGPQPQGGDIGDTVGEGSLELPRIQRLRYTESINSSCSSCHSPSSGSGECDCDKDSNCLSSETSSYNSECNDEEEIALAIQAAELASRNEARSRFRSSSDLIHRLFVCIAGVADQLQTNYASDLRHILKCVFDLNCNEEVPTEVELTKVVGDSETQEAESDRPPDQPQPTTGQETRPVPSPRRRICEPPEWVPDEDSLGCSSCKTTFTLIRRRHHCRNCGKIFCGRCSANTVPLPHYGQQKPVRVCNRCFIFQVTPFTVDD